MDIGNFSVSFSLLFDELTSVMLILVSSVSCLVHLYSREYMSGDPHVSRFMSYLSLFTFFMLILVTSNNLLQLFIG
jgi:NADH:ubiquinone oxidoreductase subunit 5 (subunit L)/multisubunit Na+/H+ antiporter MnhA subunit